MNKKIFSVFFALLLSVIPVFPTLAAGDLPRLVDAADLLSDSEEAALLDTLDEISERHQVDVVVLTLDSLEGESAMVYADDFYDYYGYGFGSGRDGILFLISMGERDWCMSTTGYGKTAFTDAGQAYMSEAFTDSLKDGDYMAAFTTFAELCDDFITQAKAGAPYDVANLPKAPFSFGGGLVAALLVGFIISLIATGIMKDQLKTVHSQSTAGSYIKEGSMQLTKTNDLFLYMQVERREKAKEDSSGSSGGSSTHTSSSGTEHGGSQGKF